MPIRLKPITIARVFGIPIKLNYGWFPVFGLHIYAVSAHYLPHHFPSQSAVEHWGLGLLTTVLLFLSVLGHELGHALFARAEGLKIYDITLHLFGGLARFDREADTPLGDFKIAVAGPAASFLHGFMFFVLNQLSIHVLPSRPAALLTNYLALTNLILALFNLLPGFPLDGGRVLRAWLWHRHGDFFAATRWVTQAGRGIAYFLIALGVFWMLTWRTSADLFIGAWAMFVGVFLKDAAHATLRHLNAVHQAAYLRVADAMKQSATIPPGMTIQQLVDDILPVHRQTSFPVCQQQRFLGVILLERLRQIPREQWASLTAKDVMLPTTANMLLHPSTPLGTAQSLLRDNQVGCAGVLDDAGHFVGFISLLEIHKKLVS